MIFKTRTPSRLDFLISSRTILRASSRVGKLLSTLQVLKFMDSTAHDRKKSRNLKLGKLKWGWTANVRVPGTKCRDERSTLVSTERRLRSASNTGGQSVP